MHDKVANRVLEIMAQIFQVIFIASHRGRKLELFGPVVFRGIGGLG